MFPWISWPGKGGRTASPPGKMPGRVAAASPFLPVLALLLSAPGSAATNPLDLPSFVSEAHRAPGSATYEAVPDGPGPSAFAAPLNRFPRLSIVGFDAADLHFRSSLRGFVSDKETVEADLPEFLTDPSGAVACHPLVRLAPGLVCSPWVAAVHLDRTWSLDETGRWRMQGTFVLAADLLRGAGKRRASSHETGPALLSDWSIGVTHAERNRHTRLSLSQPPHSETGDGTLGLPGERFQDAKSSDAKSSYEIHRFSFVPPRRRLALRLSHQRPFAGGDVVISLLSTQKRTHAPTRRRYVAGIAWRKSF